MFKTTVETSILITAPPEAVTQVILNPDLAVRWTTDLERFEVVHGNAGQPGAVARLHYLQGGQRYTMEDTLLYAEPGRCYRSRVTSDVLSAEVETTLEPGEGGTWVRIRWTGSGRRFPLRFLLPLMRGSVTRQAEADLRKLKDLVENRTPEA